MKFHQQCFQSWLVCLRWRVCHIVSETVQESHSGIVAKEKNNNKKTIKQTHNLKVQKITFKITHGAEAGPFPPLLHLLKSGMLKVGHSVLKNQVQFSPKRKGSTDTHTRAYWTLSPIKISKSLWGNSTHAMTGNYKHFKLTPLFFFLLVNSAFVFLSALWGYSTLSQMRPNRVSLGSTSSYILWFLQT